MTESPSKSPEPDPLRVLTLVRELNERHGAQQFGQLMQNLLALSFRQQGFHVMRNTVGVPDLQVSGRGRPEGYAIESKTGDATVTLSTRDLDGVKSANRLPVVAAYFLSNPMPHWLLVDAHALRPGSYRRYDLEAKPGADVGFDLTRAFCRVLVHNHAAAIEGPEAIARLLQD